MQDSTQPYDWEARQCWIDEQICRWSGEEDPAKWRGSETAWAWEALADAAFDHAERQGISDPEFQLRKAPNVIDEIRHALDIDSQGEVREKMRLWSHRRFLDDLARKKFPRVGREQVERAVDEYLSLCHIG